MSDFSKSEKDIFSPPGGILVWIIMAIEFFTFLMGIFYFYYEKSNNINLFLKMQSELGIKIATVNTIILVTSGFLVANAVSFLREKDQRKSLLNLQGSILMGILFLILKSFEYLQKIKMGHTMGENTFFNLYWFLTLFHFFHVIVGIGLLVYFFIKIKKSSSPIDQLGPLEAGASLWHMCDLIWILIFPTLYLLR